MQKNTSLRQRCANSHIILPYLSIKMARRTVRRLAAAAWTDPAHGVFFLLIGPKNTIQDSLLLLLLAHCTVVIFSWNCPIHNFFLICCSGNSGFSPLLIGPKNTIQDSLLLLLLVHCTVVIFSWNCPIVKFFNLWFSQFGLYRYFFSIIGLFIAFSIFIKHFSIRLHYEKAALVWMVPQFCSWCTYFFPSTICLFFGGFFAVFVLHLFLEI